MMRPTYGQQPPPPPYPPAGHQQQQYPMNNMQPGMNGMSGMNGMNGMNNNNFAFNNGAYGQPPQQPMSMPCCPEDPNTHFCLTDPVVPQGQMPSAFTCMWQFCDGTTWLVGFWFVMSVIGFAITVGSHGPDSLLDKFGVSNAADLDEKVYLQIKVNYDAWQAAMMANTSAPTTTVAPTTTKAATTTTGAATTTTVSPPPSTTAGANTTTAATTTTAPRTAAPSNSSRSRRQVEDLDEGYPPKIRSKWRALRSLLQQATTSIPTTPVPIPNDPVITRTCIAPQSLFGAFGNICVHDSLSGTAMLMNQSRWLNFRGTLYFLAMLGTLTLFIIIVVVNKQQAWLAAQNGTGAAGFQGAPMAQPPYNFHGTPLYYSFRIAWGTVSIIVFFWMVTELYQYWWFIGEYINRTTGDLSSYWYWFDRKFVPSTICVGLFLCWPLVHLVLEFGLFIIGIIPWYVLRSSCYPQLATATVDPEKPFDQHSCCVRTDLFYMGNHQMHRLGFSEGQWVMWTGSKAPFCSVCECQMQQPGQYGGGTYGGGGAPSGNVSMMGGGGAEFGRPPRPMASMSGGSQQGNMASMSNGGAGTPTQAGNLARSSMSLDPRASFAAQSSAEMQQSSSVFIADGGKTPSKRSKSKDKDRDKDKDKDKTEKKKKKKDKSSKSDRESD